MRELLEDLIIYLEPRADVKGDGTQPNEALDLLQRCQDALDKLKED